MNTSLLYPALAMAALTYSVGALLFYTRVRAVRAGKIQMKYFRTYNEGQSTEAELKASHHFINLFEVPVLFYTAICLALLFSVETKGMEIAAWIFVAARLAHAYFHIGPNRLYPRMISFFTGVFSSMAMWILIAVEVCGRG